MRRGLFGELSLEDCVKRYKTAVDEGLLKVMSKMGIAVISSYRGGCNFEAVGLSRTLVDEYFPAMPSRISGLGPDRHPAEGAGTAPAGLGRGRSRSCRSAASTAIAAAASSTPGKPT